MSSDKHIQSVFLSNHLETFHFNLTDFKKEDAIFKEKLQSVKILKEQETIEPIFSHNQKRKE